MNDAVVLQVAVRLSNSVRDAKAAPGTVISGAGINPVPFFPFLLDGPSHFLNSSTAMRLVRSSLI
jgi:hypothetical protein